MTSYPPIGGHVRCMSAYPCDDGRPRYSFSLITQLRDRSLSQLN